MVGQIIFEDRCMQCSCVLWDVDRFLRDIQNDKRLYIDALCPDEACCQDAPPAQYRCLLSLDILPHRILHSEG